MVQSDPVSRHKGPEHIAAYEWMMDYAAGVIAERRARPGSDLISQFVFAEIDSQRLEEREVLLTTTTLIMAGIESLGGFLAMFGLNLADVPDARRALLAERALIPDAIEESLRYNTSAQRFRRRLTVDMEMHGRTMRAGDTPGLWLSQSRREEVS
jgi:cytochrome P450